MYVLIAWLCFSPIVGCALALRLSFKTSSSRSWSWGPSCAASHPTIQQRQRLLADEAEQELGFGADVRLSLTPRQNV